MYRKAQKVFNSLYILAIALSTYPDLFKYIYMLTYSRTYSSQSTHMKCQ